ncbi:uncharacterized protein H6S33_010187 [Morchella sextelata]|uniref:uncharacterized protein n=1 Tax=Morchella sextelata TaxID=1174677 RepID=UPI001D03F13F|nr:uncharacterized protein H6S33_010187 [Morchella sextelata]KAH0612135.1 hypothetical protein H6S33_010187 [Morchella sextelata]
MATAPSANASRSTTPTPSRITLFDNTLPAAPSPSPTASDENLPSAASSSKAPGRRETLRKAIAYRKYKRWSVDPFPSDEHLSAAGGVSPPDPRAAGVVERVGEDEEALGSSSGSEEGRRGRQRSDTGGNGPKVDGDGQERRTGRRKDGKEEKEVAEIDILYENQRGMFVCGIPLFSAKGLLNFDPSPWQNRHYHGSAVSIVNAQVPDPTWTWAWKTWYVDMTTDVDEEGWTYSFSFSPAFSWHGTHIWFHSFVRRRRWLRKRIKLHGHDSGSTCSSRSGSRERGHTLNPDYFTIHSHSRHRHAAATADGSTILGGGAKKKKKRGLMGGEGWDWKDEDGDGRDDAEQAQQEGIKDIPTLMNVLRAARLDREKVEAVENFLKEAGDEVEYLPERVPAIMALMIFQASRRQLLSLLVRAAEDAERAEEGPDTPVVEEEKVPEAPLPPTVAAAEPTTPLSAISASSQNLLLPPSPVEAPVPPLAVPIKDESVPEEPAAGSAEAGRRVRERRERRTRALRGAVQVAEGEVKRMEYWSDVAGAAGVVGVGLKEGEEEEEEEEEEEKGGETFTGGAGAGGKYVGSAARAVDRKGKGRDTSV